MAPAFWGPVGFAIVVGVVIMYWIVVLRAVLLGLSCCSWTILEAKIRAGAWRAEAEKARLEGRGEPVEEGRATIRGGPGSKRSNQVAKGRALDQHHP